MAIALKILSRKPEERNSPGRSTCRSGSSLARLPSCLGARVLCVVLGHVTVECRKYLLPGLRSHFTLRRFRLLFKFRKALRPCMIVVILPNNVPEALAVSYVGGLMIKV